MGEPSFRLLLDAKSAGKATVTDAAGQLVQIRGNVDYSTLGSSTVTDYDQYPDRNYSWAYHLGWKKLFGDNLS